MAACIFFPDTPWSVARTTSMNAIQCPPTYMHKKRNSGDSRRNDTDEGKKREIIA